ncbi:MAG: TonB-dependent receptor [Bacteroidales bacterium]|nr:TonB-dependent receptor [Bacteroidales bacterium]
MKAFFKPIIRLFFFALLSLVSLDLGAQSKITVTGLVSEETGAPVIGAAVMLKGSANVGTVTGLDGDFSISVPENAVLEFSFFGFKTQEIAVNGQSVINVTLAVDTQSLEEVVVVGYGTASKKLISSSIASVKMDDIDRGAEIDPVKSLQGRVTGVSVTSPSGIPGAAPNIIVRGVSSISGSSSPLYVVDGIPAESYPNINANDIESMEVLKDASATAIYGSRANAGVIIITTKSGKAGKTKVDVDANFGLAQVANDIKMANTNQYIDVMQAAIDNYNVYVAEKGSGSLKELYIPDNPADFDWVGAISRKWAQRRAITASLQGGSDKTTFYISTGYEGQEGYLNKTEFNKYTIRTKVGHEIAKWIKLNVNIAGAYARYDMTEEQDGSLKVLRAAREEQPWYTPYCTRSINDFGKEVRENAYSGDYRTMSTDALVRHNPVMCINEEDYYNNKYQLSGTASFDITPIKGLKYTPSISAYTIYDHSIKKLTEKNTERGYKDGWHALTEQKNNSIRWVFDNVISWNHEWEKLTYNLMVGHSFEKYEYNTFGAASDNYANQAFPSSGFNLITSGSNIYAGSIGYNAYALESYFARAAFNWDNRYILNLSFRADGSSRFPKNNRFGFFPAGSFAWIMTNEPFFPKDTALSQFKLRASVGQTGSMAGIGNWAAMNLVNAGSSYNGVSGLAFGAPAQDLKWEKSTKYNIGFDSDWFSDKMYANFDFYYSRTDDLLYSKPVIATSGYTSLTSNIGQMDNLGIELTVGGTVMNVGDFKWDMMANFSWAKNKLVKLLDNTDLIYVNSSNLYGGNKHAIITGQPISTWYMLKAEGLYQDDSEVPEKLYAKGVRAGDVKYYDANGDGDIDYNNDRVINGKATADFFGGLNSNMSWNGLELNIFCQYSIGGKIFAAWKGAGQEGTEHMGLSSGSVVADNAKSTTQYFNVSRHAALNYWRGEGTSNTIPRPTVAGMHTGWDVDYNILTSSRFLQDASYFKVKTITLAYHLPQRWMDRIKMGGIKVFFTVDNAFTFTSYDGYDPEVSIDSGPAGANYGVDFGYQPTLRSFLLGASFKF